MQRHILTFEFGVECSCVFAEGSLSHPPPQKKHFTGSLATPFCKADVKRCGNTERIAVVLGYKSLPTSVAMAPHMSSGGLDLEALNLNAQTRANLRKNTS